MKKFNVRVYGIVFNDKKELLVAHETRGDMNMTKLPGGGLEWGEGLKEGLEREFVEELNWVVEVNELFYLTDYFQVSSLNSDDQVLSVYYYVKKVAERSEPHIANEGEIIDFEWVSGDRLGGMEFTFPIDRLVIRRLIDKHYY